MNTTTQLEMINVTVQKVHGLDNQQPSPLMFGGRFNDQGLSRTNQAVGKCAAPHERLKIWSDLHRNMQHGSLLFGHYMVLSERLNLKSENAMNITVQLVEKFHEKWVLDKKTGCWVWAASTAGKGYGQIKIPGTRQQIYAHRLSYLIHYGEIEEGMSVCHICDNTKCVKPSHLFLGTTADNLQDMKAKSRHLYGALNRKSKLTDDKVRRIHSLANDGLSQQKIASLLGVSQSTVWKILNGLRWEHIFSEINPDGI
jgi:predicted XRE-type DNA-binding protein